MAFMMNGYFRLDYDDIMKYSSIQPSFGRLVQRNIQKEILHSHLLNPFDSLEPLSQIYSHNYMLNLSRSTMSRVDVVPSQHPPPRWSLFRPPRYFLFHCQSDRKNQHLIYFCSTIRKARPFLKITGKFLSTRLFTTSCTGRKFTVKYYEAEGRLICLDRCSRSPILNY